MNKSINTFVGFVAGAATGAITGMLVAPDKGYKTQNKKYHPGKDTEKPGAADSIKD